MLRCLQYEDPAESESDFKAMAKRVQSADLLSKLQVRTRRSVYCTQHPQGVLHRLHTYTDVVHCTSVTSRNCMSIPREAVGVHGSPPAPSYQLAFTVSLKAREHRC